MLTKLADRGLSFFLMSSALTVCDCPDVLYLLSYSDIPLYLKNIWVKSGLFLLLLTPIFIALFICISVPSFSVCLVQNSIQSHF